LCCAVLTLPLPCCAVLCCCKQMLEFLRHPHLPLASAALSFWATIVREAGGGPGKGGSPLHSPRDMSADGGPAQQQQQQVAQQQPNNPASVPPQACKVRGLWLCVGGCVACVLYIQACEWSQSRACPAAQMCVVCGAAARLCCWYALLACCVLFV
jgi:hypothetical protein